VEYDEMFVARFDAGVQFLAAALGAVDADAAESLRFIICRLCGQVFFLCRWCDDGNVYCGDTCSEVGRSESQRAAGRRYQQTEAGRSNHAARQQRYLDRREAAKMTHQTAKNLPTVVEVVSPPPPPAHDAQAAMGGGEEKDHAFNLGGHRLDERGDPRPGDGGSLGDRLESSAIGDGAAPAGRADAARSTGDVGRSAGPRCARCGRAGRFVRHETLSRCVDRPRRRTPLQPRVRPRAQAPPS
jgi:hypothetical protein